MNIRALPLEKQKQLLQAHRVVGIYKAKEDFWEFCKLLMPDFYKESRPHLKNLCYTLQYLYEGRPQEDGIIYKKVMINTPPQFGKTLTMSNWCKWVLGKSTKERFILGSYSDTPATDMSRAIRDGITEVKNMESDIVYSDIFPDTKLKYGDSGVKRWALEGEHFNFLAAGIIGGGVTGKGATIKIFDDLIKGREEALNEEHKSKVYGSKSSTWDSRKDASVEEALEVMIATRWALDDPCGRELELRPDEWFVFNMPAYNEETGEMLCSDFLSYEQYHKKLIASQQNIIEESIFLANYQQETVDKKGLLYKPFKTYTELPSGIKKNKTDTADEGEDYLCSICYNEDAQGYCYVTDILYTQEAMEITEPALVRMLMQNRTRDVDIESNNGGRGFARNIDRDTPTGIDIWWHHQSSNKASRIYNNSSTVNKMIIFPDGWKSKWPTFYKHLTTYKTNFKANKHDDTADVLTSMVERQGGDSLEVDVY